MKNIFSIAILLLNVLSCNSNSDATGFKIEGKLSHLPSGTKIYLEEISFNAKKIIDTTITDNNGSFALNGVISNMGLFQLRTNENKVVFLILDEHPVSVHLDADTSDFSKFTYKISGSAYSEILRSFVVQAMAKANTMNAAVNDYQANEEANDSVKNMYSQRLQQANTDYHDFVKNFVDTVKNPVMAVFAIGNLNYNNDKATYENLEKQLREKYASIPFIQGYLEYMTNQKTASTPNDPYAPKFSAGEAAPDISLTDPDGNTLTLSSLRGKYVLLDFWASWCGPCRRENPNVVSAYNVYKDKGFTVYSVSFDTDKSKWTEAIANDHLAWPTHVSELKGWNSTVGAQYGIRSIPTNFLLDPDGKILAVNLRGEDLQSTLQNLLK